MAFSRCFVKNENNQITSVCPSVQGVVGDVIENFKNGIVICIAK